MSRTSTTCFALDDTSVIDSLHHPQAATIRSLLTAADAASRASILIDDEDNVLRALDAGVAVRAVFHSDDASPSDELRQRLPADARRYTVARRTCKKLFGNERASRAFAVADAPLPQPLDALAAAGRDVVVLDGLSIAGNVGAIIRTSVAMAVGGVALVNMQSVSPFDRRVIRASRGLVFSLPLVATSVEALVDFCSRCDLPLLVLTPSTERSLDEMPPSRPIALVLGAEKTGCSRQLALAATLRASIPTSPAVQSLNVAAAAAIALHNRYRFNSTRFPSRRARAAC